jgi:putative hydrolase of the HAD superfamily
LIKNIVFDLGNVLVEFNPQAYLEGLGYSAEEIPPLIDIIYGDYWNRYDRGDYKTVADLRIALCKKYPKYGNDFFKILQPDWVNIHRVITDTADYLGELKQRGYKIYILSNLATESYEFVKKLDFFQKIDGGVFSTFENACKPEEKLYRVLLERYNLNADECVFLDDKPENIEVAEKLGINGIVFTDFGTAKQQLEKLLK